MKNTHKYNPYNFSLIEANKMVFRGGPDRPPTTAATPKASKEMAKEYQNNADKLAKKADNLDKSNEYAGLEEMEVGAGAKHLKGLKASIANQLKAFWKHVNSNEMTKEERQIQFDSLVFSLNDKIFDAPLAMNEKANQLYEEKERAGSMYYSSTFMDDRLPEMAQNMMSNVKMKLPKEVLDMLTEWGFQATQDNPVKIADLVFVKEAIIRNPQNPKTFMVNEKNPAVKKYQAAIRKSMKEALDREIARRKMLPEAGARYLVGKAKNENPKSLAALDKLAQKVAKRIKNGLSPVNLRLSSMTSVEGKGNDRLSKRRANAQKVALGKLLAKYVGKGWEKKVRIMIVHEQVQPELKTTDFPKELRDKHRKGVKNASLAGAPDVLTGSIAQISKIKNPQVRLYKILELLAGTPNGKAVLREYNDYMALVIKGKSVQAESFLKKAKHINKSHVLNYLHKTVGRSRSTEVKLMTPELYAAALKHLSGVMASRYPGHNVKTIKGAILINEVTSADPSKEKLVMRLKPTADASKYIAYGPDGKRKGAYSVAQIESGKMDKMFA